MKQKAQIKNILVIRSDRFGEFLLNLPALRALKEAYPKARLVLAVSPVVYDLAVMLEYVDEAVIWDEVKKNLRKYNFDLCVVLNPSKEVHLKCFLAAISVRVGYDRKWGFLLTKKIKDTKYLGNRHEVECNLELVGLADAHTQDKSISLRVSESFFPEFIGKKIIAIHPFTSDPVKQWPLDKFQELAGRIKDELKADVVLVGLSLNTLNMGGNVIDMTNKTNLPELAALLKRCSLLVSSDSGPVHLAAAVGTPVIALFRNDLPGKTARRWGPWGKGHIVIEKSNLNNIGVNEVFNKVKEVIS